MILGIHHISLLISSEKTLDFYKLLGFTETFRKSRANDTVVILDGHNIQLEVFMDSRHPNRRLDTTEPLGPRHFALATSSELEDDVARLKSKFEFAGLEVSFKDVESDWMGQKYVFFTDPDGNIVELHE